MKKLYIIPLVVTVAILTGQSNIHAESFEGREDEMNKKCAVIYDAATQTQCAKYKEYLKNKSDNFDVEINNIQNEIGSAQGSIEKTNDLMKRNSEELQSYETQIANIQNVIDVTQASIETLDKQIVDKTDKIKKRDILMRKQMQSSQTSLGMNDNIDFLMGSNSFVDLIRRSQALGKLQSYERKEIELLTNEKKELNGKKETVKEHKTLLELQITDIANKKEKVIALRNANNVLLTQYRMKEATLLEQKRNVQMAQANIPKIDISIADSFDKEEPSTPSNPTTPEQPDTGGTTPPDSGGGNTTPPTPPVTSSTFITPLQYGWHYEAGTWQYPGGGGHMGMDFSTGQQTGIPVLAPADGIVIYSYNGGCNNNGYSSCGIPDSGGNNTLLLTKKDDTIYAMPFYHLTTATKSAGTKVSQGEVIGYSGNSGNSTGPHTHVEVIRVGVMSMSDALTKYNRTGDLTFGTGWSANSPKACGTAPCRERPESYWLK